jgi:hypothetical protein
LLLKVDVRVSSVGVRVLPAHDGVIDVAGSDSELPSMGSQEGQTQFNRIDWSDGGGTGWVGIADKMTLRIVEAGGGYCSVFQSG